jgi:sulfopyruvate decarboxylase subunit alpha
MSLLEVTMETMKQAGVTHVVIVANGENAAIDAAARQDPDIEVVDTCREGEAVALASGLALGGARPVVTMENFGLFESLDTFRSLPVDFGIGLPVFVGYTGRPAPGLGDALQPILGNVTSQVLIAGEWTEPVLDAVGMPYRILAEDADEAENRSGLDAAFAAESPFALLLESI